MHGLDLHLLKNLYFTWEKMTDTRNNKEINTVEVPCYMTSSRAGLVAAEWGTALETGVGEEGFRLEIRRR